MPTEQFFNHSEARMQLFVCTAKWISEMILLN